MSDDDELNNQLEELKNLDKALGDYGSPEPIKKDNIFIFFRELIHSDDSRKVGNLTSQELGRLRLGTRSYLEVAAYAEMEGLKKVSNYLNKKAEIIAATSMSKDGFLAKLFVTQIKKESKITDKPKQPTNWWQKNKPEEGEE